MILKDFFFTYPVLMLDNFSLYQQLLLKSLK